MKRVVLTLLFFCTAVSLSACNPITESPSQNDEASLAPDPITPTSVPITPTSVPVIVTSDPLTLRAINLTEEGTFLVSDGLKAHLSSRPDPDHPRIIIPILKFWYPSNVNSEYDEPTVTYDTGMGVINSTNEKYRCSSWRNDIDCFLLQIVELDNTNQSPEVLFSEYSGGAHCCTFVNIFSQDEHDAWQHTKIGLLDGYPFGATTIDGIDDYVIVTRDQSTLMMFGNYGFSFAPNIVRTFEAGKLVDISDRDILVPYYKKKVSFIEGQFLNSKMPTDNGFWYGYVATKARAGEFDEAWEKMLANYDHTNNWPIEGYNNFPEGLEALLKKTGYID
jgi:hypothetical protein